LKERIVLVGGGGHAGVIIEQIRLAGSYEIAGILDTGIAVGAVISGITVLGGDEKLSALFAEGVGNAAVCIGSTGKTAGRMKVFETIRSYGFKIPALVHPSAVISSGVTIAEGAQVMAGAVLQPGAVVGVNAVVNTGALIEHDCTIGAHAYISTGAVVSGGCMIGEDAFIGAGAVLIQGKTIGAGALVAAGAVVATDVGAGDRVMGVPAKAF
jgi:UDP-perosamine 4-acetyltransferase